MECSSTIAASGDGSVVRHCHSDDLVRSVPEGRIEKPSVRAEMDVTAGLNRLCTVADIELLDRHTVTDDIDFTAELCQDIPLLSAVSADIEMARACARGSPDVAYMVKSEAAAFSANGQDVDTVTAEIRSIKPVAIYLQHMDV